MQAYNAQAAVDSHSQIIVAAALTQEANDKKQLLPMLDQVAANMGRKPEHATADAGYFSAAAVTSPKVKGIELLVPPNRQKHGEGNETSPVIPGAASPAVAAPGGQPVEASAGPPAPPAKSAEETMREKLRTAAGQAIYKMRKAVVEPVFGQIKEQQGLRGVSMRGLEKSAAEWQIICLTHNLLKLFQAQTASAKQSKRTRTRSNSCGLAHACRNSGFFGSVAALYWDARELCSAAFYIVTGGLDFIPTGS
jgi:hypothetical protein